jgi:hypothetical protein
MSRDRKFREDGRHIVDIAFGLLVPPAAAGARPARRRTHAVNGLANYSADAARKPAMRMMKVAAHQKRSVGRAEIMVYTRG